MSPDLVLLVPQFVHFALPCLQSSQRLAHLCGSKFWTKQKFHPEPHVVPGGWFVATLELSPCLLPAGEQVPDTATLSKDVLDGPLCCPF
eukprot:468712-Amphidinium_carterae.1